MVARLAEPEVSSVIEWPPAQAIPKIRKSKPHPPAPAAVANPPAVSEATSIPQYRAQFIVAAARYKREPLSGLEGEVVLRLEMSATGELAAVTVTRTSGEAVLDEQALEMFRLAAPQVPLPLALRGRAFGFDVRAVYSLKD
jgi:protein TonB